MRKPPLPGRHVTDCQMRVYMTLRQTHTAAISAAKSGFSAASAYRLEKDPRLPSGKTAPRDRRRPDPLAAVWDSEVVPLLKAAPGLRPVAIFEEIGRRHPEMGDGVRRTMERRIRAWRALFGPEQEVMPELLKQDHAGLMPDNAPIQFHASVRVLLSQDDWNGAQKDEKVIAERPVIGVVHVGVHAT